MRYSNWVLLSGLLAFSTACTSREPSEVQWRGQSFREVRTIKSLPLPIQNALGVGRSGLEGIADRGGRFNKTDAILDATLPFRRFAVAGLSSEAALVAVEHGGRGYNVVVFLIPLASSDAKPKETWTLFEKPKSLKELVTVLSGVAPDTFNRRDPAGNVVDEKALGQ